MNATKHHSISQIADDAVFENAYGETPLNFAPQVSLEGEESIVPQQFLDVRRTLSNLEEVVSKISVPKPYLVFAGEENGLLFIVVAIIGEENYPVSSKAAQEVIGEKEEIDKKIVYGRRWLIEPSTPTSEVVQTVLLAVKKVREHELREKIKLRTPISNHITTPFNSHLDLPLMAKSPSFFDKPASARIEQQLACITIDGLKVVPIRIECIAGEEIVLIKLEGDSRHFPDLENQVLSFHVSSKSECLHGLTQAILLKSERFLDEEIRFDGFARFSWSIDALQLANFSFFTRNMAATHPLFDTEFKDMSYRVDSSKAPQINSGCLGEHQLQVLNSYKGLQGYHPKAQT